MINSKGTKLRRLINQNSISGGFPNFFTRDYPRIGKTTNLITKRDRKLVTTSIKEITDLSSLIWAYSKNGKKFKTNTVFVDIFRMKYCFISKQDFVWHYNKQVHRGSSYCQNRLTNSFCIHRLPRTEINGG